MRDRAAALALALATVTLATALAGCGDEEPVVGSGTSETQPRNVGEFTGVELDGAADLVLTIGTPSEFRVTADDNVIDLIETEVDDDGVLKVDLPGKLTAKTPVRIEATVRSFESLDVDGSGAIEVDGLDGGDLRFRVVGTASLRAAGRADELVLEVEGAVSADTEALAVERAEIRVEGTGDVVVNASEELRVEVQGTADVTYLGAPSIESRIEGGGTVTKREVPAEG